MSTYRAEWSPEDGEYVGLCAEFPSLSWLAPTKDEAIAGIERLAADVHTDMVRAAFEKTLQQHAGAFEKLEDL
jgi:predicted RNase H-like HicB family nuclease